TGDPVAIAAWQLMIGFAAITLCQPFIEGSWPVLTASPAAMVSVAFTGVAGSGVAYIIWFASVRRLPAATASLGILAAPVIGVIASVIVLGERPSLPDIVGFALILAAAACVLLQGQEAARVQPEPS
ncbi:MAG: DMT family transporter, partial [Anaerolineae bacterium]|nr:DMT family transporter [Anaerolineae bacterium]